MEERIEHAWLILNEETGALVIQKIERKHPQGPDEIRKLADGSLSVRPLEREPRPAEPVWGVLVEQTTIEAERVVISWQVEPRPLDDAIARALAAVRAEAGERILAFAPAYKQANALSAIARAPAIGMTDEYDAAMALLERVDAYRHACNVAEAMIRAAATPQGTDVVAAWPE